MEIMFSQATRNQPFPTRDLRAQLERTGFRGLEETWTSLGVERMLLLGLVVLFSLHPTFESGQG